MVSAGSGGNRRAQAVRVGPPPFWSAGQGSRLFVAGLLAVVGLFLGSGCATSLRQWAAQGFRVGPDYCPPGAELSASWRDHEQAGLLSEGPENPEWWTVFNDPVLNQLVATARRENLPLRVAALRVLEARAQLGVARGSWFPQEQLLQGAYKRTQMSENGYPFSKFAGLPGFKLDYDDWVFGAQLAWELDFWGRFRRMIESAEANLESEQWACRAALVLLQAETASTYLQLRTTDERLALARKNAELQRETLRIAKARFDNGNVSAVDVYQAEAMLANTEAAIPLLETLRRVSENRLCTLLGAPPQDLGPMLAGADRIPEVPPEIVVGIPADLLRRRPDVLQAERRAAAQCARIGVAEAEFYPHIAITGQLGYQAENFSSLFDARSFTGVLAPGFRWNLLNYGRIRNSVLMEDARFRQAVLGYRETVLRASEEVEGAITAFLKEKVRVRQLSLATEATNKAFEVALAQYKEDVIDFQRVIDSQRALLQQQDALAEARGKVAMHLVTIYKALGGGWQPAMIAAGAVAEVPEMLPGEPLPDGALLAEPAPDGMEIVPPGTRGPTILPGDVPREPAPPPPPEPPGAP